MLKWTGQTITSLSLHKRRINPFNFGYGLEHIPFLLLYMVSFYYCYGTIGTPYAMAIQELKDNGHVFPNATATILENGMVQEMDEVRILTFEYE